MPEEGLPLEELMPPDYIEQAEARLRQATSEVGLPYQRRGRVLNTHLAHEAAMYAERQGKGDEFHKAVLRTYRQDVDQAIAQGQNHDISGVPAVVFGPGAVLSGAQPYEVFERAMGMFGVPKR